MWLICGLGNPGRKYTNTPHNIGFAILNSIIREYDFKKYKIDKSKEIFKGSINNKTCLLCKPLTYMNMSGSVISEIKSFYKISVSKIIIIHDDLDLALGKIKIKIGGGNAGHNGLKSIDDYIGKNYKRLRFGIGHPGIKKLVNSYVLKEFNINDKKEVSKKIELISSYFYLIFDNKSLFLTKLFSNIKKN